MQKFRIKDPTGSFFNPTDSKTYIRAQEFQADDKDPRIIRAVRDKIIFKTGDVPIKAKKPRKTKPKT